MNELEPISSPPPPTERFVGDPATESVSAIIRRRRRAKMLWFIAFETLAICITVGSALAGISTRFAEESLTPIFHLLPIGAAIVVVILPVIFFGDPKRRNRSRR